MSSSTLRKLGNASKVLGPREDRQFKTCRDTALKYCDKLNRKFHARVFVVIELSDDSHTWIYQSKEGPKTLHRNASPNFDSHSDQPGENSIVVDTTPVVKKCSCGNEGHSVVTTTGPDDYITYGERMRQESKTNELPQDYQIIDLEAEQDEEDIL